MTFATGSTGGSSPHHPGDSTEAPTHRDPELAELVARRTAQLRRARALGLSDPSESYWSLQLGGRKAGGSR